MPPSAKQPSVPFGSSTERTALITFVLVALLAVSASAEPRGEAPHLLVKFHAEGEHALLDCAAGLHRSQRAFASATRDGSPSVDALNERYGVRRVRPLFRSSDGRPFAEQRRAMRERLAARRRPGVPRAAAAVPVEAQLPDLSHIYRIELAEEVPVEEAVRAFAADPHVVWAQTDHRIALDAPGDLPDDPFLHSSGSWGQAFADLWGLLRVGAPDVWAKTQGQGVVVAVVDTGLDYLHPDIAANVFVHPGEDLDHDGVIDPEEWNGRDDDGNGYVDDLRGFDFANSFDANGDGDYDDEEDSSDPDPWDDQGHGTHVAGTIAAVAGNGLGVAGVAPAARIMPLKGFAAGEDGRDSVLWQAVLYALANGARVVNASWSCRDRCPENPLAEEIVEVAHALGAIIVTSAGNSQDDAAFKSPENRYETITVGSSGTDDRLSDGFSNYGLVVDLLAPGGGPVPRVGPPIVSPHKNVLSLRAADSLESDSLTVADDYVRMAGTSMSAPHVSGAVALLLALDPTLRYATIKSALRLGAIDIGPPGHDAESGAGRLDVPGTLAALPDADGAVRFTAPAPMVVLDPLAGPHRVRALVEGAFDEVALEYGQGLDPASWLPVDPGAPPRAVEGGGEILAEWATDELVDGAYTLRLRAMRREGPVLSEFLPLSLERHRPRMLSERRGESPVVARGRVIYEEIDRDAPTSRDLRLIDVGRGLDRPLLGSAGDRRDADIDGALVAWREGAWNDTRAPIHACRLRGASGGLSCDPFTVAGDPRIREQPVVSRGGIFWGEVLDGGTDLLGCRIHAGRQGCAPGVVQGGPGTERSPGAWRDHLVWIASEGTTQGFAQCRLDPVTGRCPARPVQLDQFVFLRPAVGEGVIAWETFGLLGGEVWLCPLDPEAGDCPAQRIAGDALGAAPRMSGRRLVFGADSAGGNRDVWLCEWDPVLQRCPLQQLTGSAASQTHPDVDGDLVVWQDDRTGEPRIFGLWLPHLMQIGDRRAVAGRPFTLHLRAWHRGEAAPRLEAGLADGRPLEAIGARLVQRRPGLAEIRWRPDPAQAGVHTITVTARSETGLLSQETIRIRVEATHRRGRWPDRARGRPRS